MLTITEYVLIPAIVAFFAVVKIYFKILRLAKTKHLVDNPDARKLQKVPVPVMGGLAVYIGILAGLSIACCMTSVISVLVPIIIGAGLMLYLGVLDDTICLKPTSRLIMETVAVLVLIYGSHSCIDDLHGLWDINEISWNIAVPLTVFAGVGIINAINMIDGINGLSSGLCIMCSILFGITFIRTGNMPNAILSFIMAASLVSFFLHNVFGKTSRMFIGDAGTMMMGIMLTWFVIQTLASNPVFEARCSSFCNLVAMTVSILIVPIADTLRVMTLRMCHGKSPFSPDKTHLHHAFIACGFSHIATSFAEVSICLVTFFISYWTHHFLHLSPTIQLYVVIFLGVVLVWCPYTLLTRCKDNKYIRGIASHTQYQRKGWWLHLQHWLDSPEMEEEIDNQNLIAKIDRKFRN